MPSSKREDGSGTAIPKATGKVRLLEIIGNGELLRMATSNLGSPSDPIAYSPAYNGDCDSAEMVYCFAGLSVPRYGTSF
jgi:hypothetical protein